MDLFLQNKIILTKNKIEIIDSNSTGDEYLDQILSFIKNSKKQQYLMNLIRIISQKYTQYYYLYLDLMEQEGILKSEIRSVSKEKPNFLQKLKFLERVFDKVNKRYRQFTPIIKEKHYFLENPEIKSNILQQIYDLVNKKEQPSVYIIYLTILVEVSGLINVYLRRNLRKKAFYRLREILNSGKLDPSSKMMILRIRRRIKNIAMEPMLNMLLLTQ